MHDFFNATITEKASSLYHSMVAQVSGMTEKASDLYNDLDVQYDISSNASFLAQAALRNLDALAPVATAVIGTVLLFKACQNKGTTTSEKVSSFVKGLIGAVFLTYTIYRASPVYQDNRLENCEANLNGALANAEEQRKYAQQIFEAQSKLVCYEREIPTPTPALTPTPDLTPAPNAP